MEYRNLGRSGLRVSRLCLGTMNFGARTPEDEAFRIMDRALEHGINFFDTADVYSRPAPKGTTETIIGRWFAQDGGGRRRRDKVVLATKLYGEMDPWPNNSRFSALSIRKACEASLQRLQTDRIDLYQMHHVAREISWEEIWQGFEQLYTSGKIVYNGSSNFAAWHIALANESAKRRNYMGLISEQSIYNIAERTIELEVIPACEHYGLGLLPWSPLSGGLLAGILDNIESGRRASESIQKQLDSSRPQIEAYEALCREIGLAPATVALSWLLHQPAVTSPIVGPRTVQQLDEAVEALSVTLSGETLKRIDELFPGPGGTAPEAYAW